MSDIMSSRQHSLNANLESTSELFANTVVEGNTDEKLTLVLETAVGPLEKLGSTYKSCDS